LQDGIIISNGTSFFSLADLTLISEAMSASIFLDPALLITTGLYGRGTEEDNAMVDSILGSENDGEKFALYFYWFNTIHELAHAIFAFHGTAELHMVEEEQLVNAFAVAFWEYYGENGMIDELESIITHAVNNVVPPVEGVSHLDYMREMVDTGRFEEAFTFNNYGWFQFNIVNDALQKKQSLESILTQMGIENIEVQPRRTLAYATLDENTIPEIIADAISEMRGWGLFIPDAFIAFDDDPKMHSMSFIGIPTAERHVEIGRLIPVFQS
jgi:hypothetical protein